jgi:hypothetical protein
MLLPQVVELYVDQHVRTLLWSLVLISSRVAGRGLAQKKAAGKRRAVARVAKGQKRGAVSCGLCGQSTKELRRTQCCGEWMCEEEAESVLFSDADNSCHRNQDRETLCASHYHEGHGFALPRRARRRVAGVPGMSRWVRDRDVGQVREE